MFIANRSHFALHGICEIYSLHSYIICSSIEQLIINTCLEQIIIFLKHALLQIYVYNSNACHSTNIIIFNFNYKLFSQIKNECNHLTTFPLLHQ